LRKNGEAMRKRARSAERPSERSKRLDRLVTRHYHYVQLPVQLVWATVMDAITYTKARATLAQTIDSVCENHEPVIITKKNDRSVVLLSLEDYQALEETSYLLRNPKNARRLLDSVNELDAGGGTERTLSE
jgi:antitoxin YefM